VILVGDAREMLRRLPADSAQTCVTSPPYWGQRDYGVAPSIWGGKAKCAHAFGTEIVVDARDHKPGRESEFKDRKTTNARRKRSTGGAFCSKCGAWRGCLGLEPNPTLFCEHLVEVFREVRRVLRPDGTCWIHAYPVLTHPDTLGTSLEGGYPCRWRRARRSERSLRGATC